MIVINSHWLYCATHVFRTVESGFPQMPLELLNRDCPNGTRVIPPMFRIHRKKTLLPKASRMTRSRHRTTSYGKRGTLDLGHILWLSSLSRNLELDQLDQIWMWCLRRYTTPQKAIHCLREKPEEVVLQKHDALLVIT